jgi:hypothetical protein
VVGCSERGNVPLKNGKSVTSSATVGFLRKTLVHEAMRLSSSKLKP